MLICFACSEKNSPELRGARRISGQNYALDIINSDASVGPFYPVAEEIISNDHARFFAGRLSGRAAAPDASFWNETDFTADGSWIALDFNRKTDTLRAWSDMFLLQRWYYTESDNRIYLSNSLEFLSRVAALHEIEWQAAAYMLYQGYLPGALTPLKDAKSLRSGDCLEIADGKIQIKTIARIPVSPAGSPLALENAIPAIQSSLESAVASELSGLRQIILPLSGGMDSRYLLGAALNFLEPEQITTITFGGPGSLDLRIGTRIADKTGVKSISLPIDKRPANEWLEENFATTEGMYWTFPEYPVAGWRDAVPRESFLLSGYVGDVVFGSYERPEREALSNADPNGLLLSAIKNTARASHDATVKRLLQSGQTDPLAIYSNMLANPSANWLEHYDRWVFENHQMNRTNFAVGVQRDRGFYLTPFVHRAVITTAYSLPRDLRRRERAFFAAFQSKYPALFDVPTTSNFGYPPKQTMNPRIFAARGIRRILSDLDRTLGQALGTILYHHPRQNYAHPRELFRKIHAPFVLRALSSLRDVNALNRHELDKIITNYRERKPVPAALLKSLLTIYQWRLRYERRLNS